MFLSTAFFMYFWLRMHLWVHFPKGSVSFSLFSGQSPFLQSGLDLTNACHWLSERCVQSEHRKNKLMLKPGWVSSIVFSLLKLQNDRLNNIHLYIKFVGNMKLEIDVPVCPQPQLYFLNADAKWKASPWDSRSLLLQSFFFSPFWTSLMYSLVILATPFF